MNCPCPQALAEKLRNLSNLPPVGNDALLRVTRGDEGGLRRPLARLPGVVVVVASCMNENSGD